MRREQDSVDHESKGLPLRSHVVVFRNYKRASSELPTIAARLVEEHGAAVRGRLERRATTKNNGNQSVCD